MECPKCKAKLDKKDKYCPNCDLKIKGRIKFKNEHIALMILSVLLVVSLWSYSNKVTYLENQITNLNEQISGLQAEKQIIVREKNEEISNLNVKMKQLETKISELSKQQTSTPETMLEEKEFWNLFCDSGSTDLQKQNMFNKHKNSYISTTGEIKVVHTNGEVYLKHCDNTWSWDIEVKMQSDQIDKLLAYKKGDKLIYKARLTTFDSNAIISSELKADNGIIIS